MKYAGLERERDINRAVDLGRIKISFRHWESADNLLTKYNIIDFLFCWTVIYKWTQQLSTSLAFFNKVPRTKRIEEGNDGEKWSSALNLKNTKQINNLFHKFRIRSTFASRARTRTHSYTVCSAFDLLNHPFRPVWEKREETLQHFLLQYPILSEINWSYNFNPNAPLRKF